MPWKKDPKIKGEVANDRSSTTLSSDQYADSCPRNIVAQYPTPSTSQNLSAAVTLEVHPKTVTKKIV